MNKNTDLRGSGITRTYPINFAIVSSRSFLKNLTARKFYFRSVSIHRLSIYTSALFILLPILYGGLIYAKASSKPIHDIGKVSCNNVYVRAKPGQVYADLCRIPEGKFVDIIDEHAEWYGIIPPKSAVAWISINQITNGRINASIVPIFSGPNTVFSVYGRLQHGDHVEVIEVKGRAWAKIVPPPQSTVGWIRKDCIEFGDFDKAPIIDHIETITIAEDAQSHEITIRVREGIYEYESSQILTVTASSSNQNLISDDGISLIFSDDTNAANPGTLQLYPKRDASGDTTITLTASDGKNATQSVFNVVVIPENDPPTISIIDDKIINENALSFSIPFIADEGGGRDEDVQDLNISIKCSNNSLFPAQNVVIIPTDTTNDFRQGVIQLNPVRNTTGSADFYVIVSDGEIQIEEQFSVMVVAVNDPPAISSISDITIFEDSYLKGLTFNVDEGGGDDEDVQILTITTKSSNAGLIPTENIKVTFIDDETDAGPAKLDIVPIPDRSGVSTISVIVSDGTHSYTESFNVTVRSINDHPKAFNYQLTTEQDIPIVSILRGFDPEGSLIRFEIVEPGLKGSVSLANDFSGVCTYIPNSEAEGSDFFTYRVNDGTDDSLVAKVTIDIRHGGSTTN